MLGGPHNRFGPFGREKNFLLVQDIETCFVDFSMRSVITVLTELSGPKTMEKPQDSRFCHRVHEILL
jgi:hypothetical protein